MAGILIGAILGIIVFAIILQFEGMDNRPWPHPHEDNKHD